MSEIVGAWTNERRAENMSEAMRQGFSMLEWPAKRRWLPGKISIGCYGPSLNSTIGVLRAKAKHQPTVSVSGSYRYLLGQGIVPSYHVECDPRPHKVEMMAEPDPRTIFLMASCCDPGWWDKLRGCDVRLWHLINGDGGETVRWVEENGAGTASMVGGGSTVGQRAMNVCAMLGFRRFEVFGMDCSFTSTRHAGPHTGKKQNAVWVQAGTRKFCTTPQLAQSAVEMEHFLQENDVHVRFYGDGLMQEMARILKARRKIA